MDPVDVWVHRIVMVAIVVYGVAVGIAHDSVEHGVMAAGGMSVVGVVLGGFDRWRYGPRR